MIETILQDLQEYEDYAGDLFRLIKTPAKSTSKPVLNRNPVIVIKDVGRKKMPTSIHKIIGENYVKCGNSNVCRSGKKIQRKT